MSPSPEVIAVHSPLSLVQLLHSRHSLSPDNDSHAFFDAVRAHFSSLLADHVLSIPSLDATFERGKLCRFRCMVQDTGLAPEVYALHVGPSDGTGRGCCAYSEGPASGSPIIGFEETSYDNLSERQVFYATSVPGETDWHASSLSASSSSQDLAGALNTLSISPTTTAYTPPPSLSSKYPLHPAQHHAAIVKIYPGSSEQAKEENAFKTTQVVDLVGILDYSPFPSSSSTGEDIDNTVELVKTLHVLYRLPDEQVDTTKAAERGKAAWQKVREGLIAYIAQSLRGDLLAAECVLLSLFGRIYARRGALALGQLPLNLILPNSFSPSACSEIASSLSNTLKTLVPLFVNLEFSIGALNRETYQPESRDESLISGRLQLPKSTVVCVDETRLGEGTLLDRGVKNVQALSQAINDQTLAYVFPYSSFTFETDFRVIVLSQGKSLLPVECVVHLRPANIPPTSSTTVQPTEAQLAQWRDMLLSSSSSSSSPDFSIPEEISQFIQADFVSSRQSSSPLSQAEAQGQGQGQGQEKRKQVTQEDLVLRLTMARLLGISRGKKELGKQEWEETRELDERRKERILPAVS